MVALNRTSWITPVGNRRASGYRKYGFTGDHITPTSYDGYGGTTRPLRWLHPRVKTWQNEVDIPNSQPIADAANGAIFTPLYNKSWSKLVSKVRGDLASMGEALGEGREAMEMIVQRCGSLYRAYGHLRKGRFRAFLRALSVGPKRKHRNKIKNSIGEVSGLWLEYSFGWKPLTQDIYDACTTLTKPVPGGHFSASSGTDYRYYYRVVNSVERAFNGLAVVKQAGDFAVVSPNLYLLAQTGLANPINVAWNLTPLSFLADWLFDVSSFLGGFSDLLGLDYRNTYNTAFLKAYGFYETSDGAVSHQDVHIWFVKRRPGLVKPVPNFHVLSNLGQSVNRAANAASLLGVFLTK